MIKKLAVLADIHANLVALQAVAADIAAWQPDKVIVAGDVVNRGPRPLECLRFVQKKQRTEGWLAVRGNHEDYVISHTKPDTPHSGLEFEIHRHSYWTYQQLNRDVSALEALPDQLSLVGPNSGEVRITHASMQGNRDGIFPETPDEELRRKIHPSPTLFCAGHTHRPLVRRLDGTLVVNVGSVGLPFDGDPRASYARLSWQENKWQAQIVRLKYNRAKAEQDFCDPEFIEGSGPLAQLIIDEFHTAQSRLYQWTKKYYTHIRAGELSITASVYQFLAELS